MKRWIAGLLAISCTAAFFLFIDDSSSGDRQFMSAAEIDDLIQQTFDRFNLPPDQIRTRTIRIDTSASRKEYTVDVAPGFSKTQWHYELARLLKPYNSDTPARVFFPDRDMRIFVTYGSNIVRTIRLQTDPDLVLYN
ncbi:MAG: hypothetical protein WEC12_01680 [Balneolaceae bacterium]